VKHAAEVYGLRAGWHFMYGRNYGWALRFQRGDRLVLAMYPNKNRFTVQIILSQAQVKTALAMGLAPRIMQVLRAATKYPEGRWLFIPVKSPAGVRDLWSVIKLKIARPKSRRSPRPTSS
jgi:hypothetical protein